MRPFTLSTVLALALAWAFATPAFAGKLEGVTLPDTIQVGGQKLLLNGMGLREKVFIDVYVAGLYLPEKTRSARTAINSDVPKRIEMVMMRSVGKEKLADTMRESISKAGSKAVAAKAGTLAGWMESTKEGDRIILEYVPGTGTEVRVKGKKKGVIAGPEFMKAVWGIYLGPNPPTDDLKDGLLGR